MPKMIQRAVPSTLLIADRVRDVKFSNCAFAISRLNLEIAKAQ
jgi:hypothetical protein